MANSVIGALRVTLGIDSAQFTSGLKKGQTGLDKFASAAKAGFAAVAVAGAAMAAALVVGMRNTINSADDMAKAAQKFGIPVEELSRLKHAADLSGVGLETLGKGVQRLSRNMLDAEMGLKAPQRAFEALGIELRNADGTMKTSSQVMTEVAGRFATMKDGVEKTALAMTLFGRAGAELIPMFNAGADGLAAMMAEADALGITLDEKTGKAAEAFNDNLTRIGRVSDGLLLKISAHLLPVLELLSEKFLAVANNGELIERMSSGVVSALSFMSNEVAQLSLLSARLSAEFTGVTEAFGRLKSGDFSGAWSAFQAGQEKSVEMAANMKKEIDGIFSGGRVSDSYIQMRLDQAFGEAGGTAAEEFVVNFEAASKSSGARIKAAIDPMVREAASIFEATRTPLEQYQAQIARLNELLAAGAVNQETYNRAVGQAQDAFTQAEEAGKKTGGVMESIGNTISQTFSSAFQGLIDGSKKVKDVLLDLMSQFASMAANSAFKSIIGSIFGGGSSGGSSGGIGGILGKILSFDGGGHTGYGSRTGGLDGKGGFAAVLHPNETVIDHTRSTGGNSGSSDTVTIVFQDDSGRMASIADQQIKTASGTIINVAVQKSEAKFAGTYAKTNRAGQI